MAVKCLNFRHYYW